MHTHVHVHRYKITKLSLPLEKKTFLNGVPVPYGLVRQYTDVSTCTEPGVVVS